MSATVKGKVGVFELDWKQPPRGKQGQARVQIKGVLEEVRWFRDDHGIWIQTSRGIFGYDLRGERDDEGRIRFAMRARGRNEAHQGLSFERAGAAAQAGSMGASKKGVRVRAQMPGKIVRVSVKRGDVVERGQSLLVMEAMKMENDIKALAGGRVVEVLVSEGQTVETGAELVKLAALGALA